MTTVPGSFDKKLDFNGSDIPTPSTKIEIFSTESSAPIITFPDTSPTAKALLFPALTENLSLLPEFKGLKVRKYTNNDDSRLIGRECVELAGIALIRKLNAGGMGTVYYGFHIKTQEEVAVKILQPHLHVRHEFIERFNREARLLIDIRSKYLVQVISVGKSFSCSFFVMEYIRGLNALELLNKQKILTQVQVLSICIAATTGLLDAHCRRIIHRDIKPENIMIPCESDNSDEYCYSKAKLTDFGLAGFKKFASPQLTGHREAWGTREYMPPEQFAGINETTKASDIFSMGATIYRLLTGRAWNSSGIYTPLLNIIPHVHSELNRVVDKCLKLLPSERYNDAGELLDELYKCQQYIMRNNVSISPLSCSSLHNQQKVATGRCFLGGFWLKISLQQAARLLKKSHQKNTLKITCADRVQRAIKNAAYLIPAWTKESTNISETGWHELSSAKTPGVHASCTGLRLIAHPVLPLETNVRYELAQKVALGFLKPIFDENNGSLRAHDAQYSTVKVADFLSACAALRENPALTNIYKEIAPTEKRMASLLVANYMGVELGHWSHWIGKQSDSLYHASSSAAIALHRFSGGVESDVLNVNCIRLLQAFADAELERFRYLFEGPLRKLSLCQRASFVVKHFVEGFGINFSKQVDKYPDEEREFWHRLPMLRTVMEMNTSENWNRDFFSNILRFYLDHGLFSWWLTNTDDFQKYDKDDHPIGTDYVSFNTTACLIQAILSAVKSDKLNKKMRKEVLDRIVPLLEIQTENLLSPGQSTHCRFSFFYQSLRCLLDAQALNSSISFL
jgi:serine/threonine protein kinase